MIILANFSVAAEARSNLIAMKSNCLPTESISFANANFFLVFLLVALVFFFLEEVFLSVAFVLRFVEDVCFLVEEEPDECFLYPEAAPPWNPPLPVTRCPEAKAVPCANADIPPLIEARLFVDPLESKSAVC